ncbi:MAG: leucine-rich repeat domain-containing protein, partial [Saprospiraceae bacterium]
MSELALQLIAENKKTKSPRLDLGRCGMTDVPEAIGELVWLEELILSDKWSEYHFEKKQWHHKSSQNTGYANEIKNLPPTLPFLVLLKLLIFDNSKVSDLSPIASLTNLQQLYCSETQISDLSPIADLTNLQLLYCSSPKISDLSPIADLTNLQILDCSDTQVSDLSPIADLTNLQQL